MLITAKKLILRADHRPMRDGAILTRSGKIIAIGKASQLILRYQGPRVYRFQNAVLMPGLVNVHAHLELPPLLDVIRSADYPEWVLNLLKFKHRLAPSDYAAAARANTEDLAATGTTTVADISTHGASPAAIKRVGLRSIIFREFISMDRDRPLPALPRVRRSVSPLVRFGLSPHSPHTVSEHALQAVRRAAVKHNLNICMHTAETKDELKLLRGKASGLDRLYAAAGWDTAWAPRARSSFEYLQRVGILGPSFLAVHAVHVDDADIGIIKRSGAGIAHCPRSNHNLGIGKMRLTRFLEAGIPVGLGTDSLASAPSLSLWDEMRYAFRIHRSSGVGCSDIMHMATLGGARALGMGHEIGSLEPGKRADIIAVPLPERDTGDLYSDILRETTYCIMAMVNGRILFSERNHIR